LIGKEVGDQLSAEQIVCECRRMRGPVLIHKGSHRAQRYVLEGLSAIAIVSKKWRLKKQKLKPLLLSFTFRWVVISSAA
jgi:hypothetical protein